ncbi:hypothetical protein [Streptomyces ambofaciens]
MVTHPPTYDPVVEGRTLPRPPGPLPTPPPGRAWVLVPDAGPTRTVRPGEPVPDLRAGGYRRLFLVDTTEHRLVLDLRLTGRGASAPLRCRVELMCRVTDPGAVVARNIRDMSAAWHGPLRERLRNVPLGPGADRSRAAARDALNAALRDFTGDTDVRLSGARTDRVGERPLPDGDGGGAAGGDRGTARRRLQ